MSQTRGKESEIHVMKCDNIISDNYLKNELGTISYADIFGTLDEQIVAAKVWKKILRVWNLKLDAAKLSPRCTCPSAPRPECLITLHCCSDCGFSFPR